MAEYLGVVNGRNYGSDSRPIAFLVPTHLEERSGWVRLEVPKVESFPSRGQVIWLDPADEAIEGTLWRFAVGENPRADARDRFRVQETTAGQVLEIVDLRSLGDEEQIRKAIAGIGIEATAPPGGRGLLLVTDRLLLGPVAFDADPGRKRLRIRDADLAEPLPKYQPLVPQPILLPGGRRCLVPPPDEKLVVRGQRDWADDETVLRRAIKRVRKLAPGYEDAIALSDKIVDDMVERLGIAGSASDQADLDEYRLARAAAVLSRVRLTDDVARQLAEQIGALETVREVALREAQALRAGLLAQADEDAARIRKAAADDVAAALAEVEGLRAAVEADQKAWEARLDGRVREMQCQERALSEELERLERQRAESEQELDASLTTLDREMESRLQSILAKPERVLSDLAIFRAAWPAQATDVTQPGGPSPKPYPTSDPAPFWMLPSNAADGAASTDLGEALDRVESAFDELGHPPELGAIGLAGLLARSCPLAAGPDGRYALRVLANAVTGARVLSIPVSPAFLEPTDLLGQWDPRSGAIHPDKHGLLDLLLAAPQFEGLFLVILEGVNLAPAEAYLLPLLESYRGAGRLGQQRRISLAHPGMVRHDDRYSSAAQFAWPPNVLLAGTLALGAATLPLPADLWESAILFPTLADQAVTPVSGRPTLMIEGSVSLASWQKQLSRSAREDASPWHDFIEDASSQQLALPSALVTSWRTVYRSLLTLLDDEDRALDGVIASCLVPWSASGGDIMMSGAVKPGSLAHRVLAAIERGPHPLRVGAQ